MRNVTNSDCVSFRLTFFAVAETTNLTPSATRTRFAQLKKAIESGGFNHAEATGFENTNSSDQTRASSFWNDLTMSDTKTTESVAGEHFCNVGPHGWVGHVPKDSPLNLENFTPCSEDDMIDSDDEDDIPLAQVRRMKLVYSGKKPAIKFGRASTHPELAGAVLAETGRPTGNIGITGTANIGAAAAEGFVNGFAANEGGRESDMLRAHNAVTTAIDGIARYGEAAAGDTTPASDPVDSIWNAHHPPAVNTALRRAQMITRHWLNIPPEVAHENVTEPRPARTFTRSTGLADPEHASWRDYRVSHDATWAQARPNPVNRHHISAGFWGYLELDLARLIQNHVANAQAAPGGFGGQAA